MSGTKLGGQKAALTNKKNHGANFYAEIGRKGGRKCHPDTRYFAMHPEVAKQAGAIGGKMSKRGKSPKKKTPAIDHGIVGSRGVKRG